MSYTAAIIAHVLLGITGVSLSYAVTLGLKKRALGLTFLKWSSAGAFLAYMLSWAMGAYYYVFFYGSMVKPTIIAGAYPWAHNFVMEAKEHVFLVLPFLAATVWLVLWLLGGSLETAPGLKRAALLLSWTIVVLGVAITLSGMVISGAVIPK